MIDLKQKHVDSFVAKLPKDVTFSVMINDLTRYSGVIVRAANSAGWFDPALGDVDEMKPGQVMTHAKEVITAYGESLVIPPE